MRISYGCPTCHEKMGSASVPLNEKEGLLVCKHGHKYMRDADGMLQPAK
jgi:hypothetical protein